MCFPKIDVFVLLFSPRSKISTLLRCLLTDCHKLFLHDVSSDSLLPLLDAITTKTRRFPGGEGKERVEIPTIGQVSCVAPKYINFNHIGFLGSYTNSMKQDITWVQRIFLEHFNLLHLNHYIPTVLPLRKG